MTLDQFKEQIRGKFFVELSANAVRDFVNLDSESQGAAIRQAATDEGVIVFLTNIHKIFARGHYYGIDYADWDELVSKVDSIQSTINSMGEPLANIASLVAQNTSDIADNAAAIGQNVKILNGDHDVVVPSDPDDPTYADKKKQYDGLISRLNSLELEVAALTPGGTSLTEVVNQLVENYLDENVDLDSITQSLSDLQDALDDKAAQSDLEDLVDKIGGWTGNTQNHTDISTYITTLRNDLDTLSSAVDGIPNFSIVVVDLYANLPNPGNSATIYIIPSIADESDDNDIFTEYIWVNKNGAKTGVDPETDQPWEPDWGYEKLGRKALNLSQYYNKADLDDIKEYVEDLMASIDADDLSQVASNIESLSDRLDSIETTLETLIQNGVLQFTGEDIKTSTAPDSLYISEDIANLKNNKLDADALSWVVVSQEINSGE